MRGDWLFLVAGSVFCRRGYGFVDIYLSELFSVPIEARERKVADIGSRGNNGCFMVNKLVQCRRTAGEVGVSLPIVTNQSACRLAAGSGERVLGDRKPGAKCGLMS